MITINIDPSLETRRVHICYYVTCNGDILDLKAVEDVYYQHSDAPCEISRTETRTIKSCNKYSITDPQIFLLYNQQMATHQTYAKLLD